MSSQTNTILLHAYKKEMVAYFTQNPQSFDDLTTIIFENKNKFSWRAAWMIYHFMKQNDERIKPILGRLIHLLPNSNESMQRELLKIFSKMNIDEEYEGILINHCFTIWETLQKSPSVRYNALKIIMHLAQKYPEIKNDLFFFTQEDYLETLSPAIRKILTIKINEFLKKTNNK